MIYGGDSLFSFSVGQGNQPSKFTIGGYDIEKYGQPGSQLQWHNLTGTKYWSIELT